MTTESELIPDSPKPPGRPQIPPEPRATSHIHLRVHPRRKSAYVRAANKTRQTLAGFQHLDREAGYKEET